MNWGYDETGRQSRPGHTEVVWLSDETGGRLIRIDETQTQDAKSENSEETEKQVG